MEMLYALTVTVIVQVYTFIKTYKTLSLNVCKLYYIYKNYKKEKGKKKTVQKQYKIVVDAENPWLAFLPAMPLHAFQTANAGKLRTTFLRFP